MPYDSAGVYTRVDTGPTTWRDDAASGTKIKADLHDNHDNDIASALSSVITKDGRTQPTANLPMNNRKIINLGEPTQPGDAVTKNYVDALKNFSTGLNITGADQAGRVNFLGTGSNGLSFVPHDISWLARPYVANVAFNRLVLNDKADGSGTDVVQINELGHGVFNGGLSSYQNMRIMNVSALLQIIPTSGNGHVWFYNAAGTETRAIIYTSGGAQGPLVVQAGVQPFYFHSTGAFQAPADIGAGAHLSATYDVYAGRNIAAVGAIYAGNWAAYLNTDGNTAGSIWTNWGHGDAYNAIGARIEARADAWASLRANEKVALLGFTGMTDRTPAVGDMSEPGAGWVATGHRNNSNGNATVRYRNLQQKINGVWYAIGYF